MFEYESSESEDKHKGYKSDSSSEEIEEIDQNTYNNLRINLNNNPDSCNNSYIEINDKTYNCVYN